MNLEGLIGGSAWHVVGYALVGTSHNCCGDDLLASASGASRVGSPSAGESFFPFLVVDDYRHAHH